MQETASPAESLDLTVLRRKAWFRLIGSGILLLIAVICFVLVLDTQPRPLPRASESATKLEAVQLLSPKEASGQANMPASPMSAAAEIAPEQQPSTAKPDALSNVDEKFPVKGDAKPLVEQIQKADTQVSNQTVALTTDKSISITKPDIPKAQEIANDGTSKSTNSKNELKEKKESKPSKESKERERPSQAKDGRYVIQVGAFAESDKAKEARKKLEKAGVKTFTQVIQTGDGKRIRVRAGPYSSESEAERVAKRIRNKLDMSASVLQLS